MSKKKLNTRAVAAKLSWQIIDKGQSLSNTINEHYADRDDPNNDRGFVQELVYGVCRWYGTLDRSAAQLIAKPIRNKDRVLHFLLLVGIYQLRHTKTAAHAAVAETVAACQQLQRPWAKKLINGCLRTYQRQLDGSQFNSEDQEGDNQRAHPKWMADAILQAWPEYSAAIFSANNHRPPMCLRVNRRVGTRDEYFHQLLAADIGAHIDPHSADGLILEKPVGVNALPMFDDGAVSVQDTAAQLACDILNIEKGQRVLDACAAPGGKTAHILERADNQLSMHALDISTSRCVQLNGTLTRLKLSAEVFEADASKAVSWTSADTQYDRILIDAPCSGLGVIRRHPDIKHHRRPQDIDQLQQIQCALLNQLWSALKPGGLLLYMTCSILPVENEQQITAFLGTHDDAKLKPFHHPNAIELSFGKQTLPGVHGMDGFYYCLIIKSNA